MQNNLDKYNQKRNFSRTTEPKGKISKRRKQNIFVVQHHLARKDHFDLRLEQDGVLKSWAVPKGPSYNPKDKRLAILVEDHPISYQHFEGTIKKGEYGGGTVMIFDAGHYEISENFNESFKRGNLKITLQGQRLIGTWNLVHLKDEQWLLIKEKDEHYLFNDIYSINTSIITNRNFKEIENNHKNIPLNSKNRILGIEVTSKDKLIYPEITKKVVLQYYKKIAHRMLPFLKYRIISTVRCPNGIKEKSFFKKHFENEREGFVKIPLKNNQGKFDDYYFISNELGLISEVQMNSIEFHTWGSTIFDLNHPDILVFDLDPDPMINLKQLRQGIIHLKEILDDLNLKSYLKVSGKKGYHVVVKYKAHTNWEKTSDICQKIAILMEQKWPNLYTSNMRKVNRTNKIFIDWIRNTRGATSICPYSLRISENAAISMPISWDDLFKIKPNEITLKNYQKYLKKVDPWADFFD